ncbi:dTDP-L-rhamnose 4-epimerase [compost metagenome]
MPLIIFGDGEQTRDFVYVKDVVQANLAAIDRGNEQIIQVGTAHSTSINELLEKLHQIVGQELVTIYKPERTGDIRHSCLNNIKASEQLGWKPQYDLYRGLQETLGS